MNNNEIIIVDDDTVMIGFINSSEELEYTEYKSYDGGTIILDSLKKYTKEEILELLLCNKSNKS